MLDLVQAAIQLVLAIGLLYALILVVRNWRRTVPRGGDSDSEFAHHQEQLLHH